MFLVFRCHLITSIIFRTSSRSIDKMDFDVLLYYVFACLLCVMCIPFMSLFVGALRYIYNLLRRTILLYVCLYPSLICLFKLMLSSIYNTQVCRLRLVYFSAYNLILRSYLHYIIILLVQSSGICCLSLLKGKCYNLWQYTYAHISYILSCSLDVSRLLIFMLRFATHSNILCFFLTSVAAFYWYIFTFLSRVSKKNSAISSDSLGSNIILLHDIVNVCLYISVKL